MIDYGHFALQLALAVSGAGFLLGLAATISRRPPLLEAARRCLMVNALLLLVSAAALVARFLAPAGTPIELKYVWANSSRDMPGFYKLAALWGGMSGSLLFWAALLAVLSAAAFLRPLPPRRVGSSGVAIGTLLLVQGFFVALMLFIKGCQPFERLPFIVADGRGLNPLLQHPAMAIHPPLLYIGFVSLTVPFAYAMGALVSGELGKDWIVRCRRWTVFGWSILSVGIVLGGYWAYLELGWGGVWAWDPVENASLLPWLVMTAFLHSVMVQEHRGMLKIWNMGLVILAFLSTLFATFLTRSGVLSSVHTFALNEGIYYAFGGFMGFLLVVGGALTLYRVWTGELRSENRVESVLSREFAFLANNVLFLVIFFLVAFGTCWPAISEYLLGKRLVYGPPWFNRNTVPLFLALLLLMGVGPIIAWRKATPGGLKRLFVAPAIAGLTVLVGSYAYVAIRYAEEVHLPYSFYVALTFGGCAFVLATQIQEIGRGIHGRMKRRGENAAAALTGLFTANRRRYGGHIVHFSVLLIMIGFCAHSAFKIIDERTLALGESMDVAGYTLTYEASQGVQAPEYNGLQARLGLSREGERLATLVTENRLYRAGERSGQPSTTSEVALYKTLMHDVYVVAVGHPQQGVRTTFLVHINPLIDLVFVGTALLFLGSLFAAWPGGRKRKRVGDLKIGADDLALGPHEAAA